MLIIQLLRAYALECLVIQIVEGSCPGMLIIQPLRAYALECLVIQIVGGLCHGMLSHSTRWNWCYLDVVVVVVVDGEFVVMELL
ncbi:hypothetical protein MtrunA17_Chr7g0231371 [Medicago truncatula]|nr:hypothetical protein MtrunA17_Chr7g0231371 [Medicago truncatula]